jgi:hypothetical protein
MRHGRSMLGAWQAPASHFNRDACSRAWMLTVYRPARGPGEAQDHRL